MAVDECEKAAAGGPEHILDAPSHDRANAPVAGRQPGDILDRIVPGGDDGEDLEVSTRLVEDGPHGPLRKGAGAIAQDDDTEQRAIGSPSDPPYETSEHCDHRSA